LPFDNLHLVVLDELKIVEVFGLLLVVVVGHGVLETPEQLDPELGQQQIDHVDALRRHHVLQELSQMTQAGEVLLRYRLLVNVLYALLVLGLVKL
jgi:type IV secretory pathway ATPase VirB11/archaellum biosynthesis ATPase